MLEKELSSLDNRYLVNFDGRGKYSPPEFIWNRTTSATAIKFLESSNYGIEYENDLFVADSNNGYLYHFDLTSDRTVLLLNGYLRDRVANSSQELEDIIFAENFGVITDMDLGPDGYLYILSHN